MLKINLSAGTGVNDKIYKINEKLSGSITKSDFESILDLSDESGSGQLRFFDINGGVSFLEFDVKLQKNLTLSFQKFSAHYLYFIYCVEGKLNYRYDHGSKWVSVEDYKPLIVSCSPDEIFQIFFEAQETINLVLITVNREEYLQERGYNKIEGSLKEMFLEVSEERFIYAGTHNIKIAEQINLRKSIHQDGLIKRILIEGHINLILALLLQQYLDDKNKVSSTSSLSKSQLVKARELAIYLNENYAQDHKIKNLTIECGLSPAKMQTAFKTLYNRTVVDYIRNVRVEKAEELIRDTDMTISEVVYAVGFSSRSYFSKIFKKKYNCNPKKYRDKINES